MVTATHRRLVFWAPRLLTIIFIAFLSVFALDAFGGHDGVWQTLFALTMHLIPDFVLIGILVLAWRREWIGAVLFAVLAAGFVLGPLQPFPVRHGPLLVRLMTDLIIAGPGFVIAALFLVGWLRR